MSLWMGLICLLAYAWTAYCVIDSRTLGQGEMYTLSAIMAIAATRFLTDWAREGREDEERKLEGK